MSDQIDYMFNNFYLLHDFSWVYPEGREGREGEGRGGKGRGGEGRGGEGRGGKGREGEGRGGKGRGNLCTKP